MLVPRYEIQLRPAEPQALEALQRAGKTPQHTVRRVTIVLLAQEQLSNQAIAAAVGPSRNVGQKWRNRFALWEPSPLGPETEVAPLARLDAVRDLAQWVKGRGEILPMRPATGHRILAALILKPHRVRYFLTRTAPLFEEQMAEIRDL